METKKEVKEKVKNEKPKKNNQNEELLKKNAELNEKVLRLAAEMQNMRKRYEEEISNFHKYEGEELIKKILPIVDSFEMAIKLDNNDLSDDLSRFLSGFKMIYTNLVTILNIVMWYTALISPILAYPSIDRILSILKVISVVLLSITSILYITIIVFNIKDTLYLNKILLILAILDIGFYLSTVICAKTVKKNM